MRTAIARAVGMSETDIDALEYLEAEGPMSQRDLGERLSITSGAVTMLVDRLEDAGLVRRGPHPSDRRYVMLELTSEAGRRSPKSLVDYHSRVRAVAAKVRPEHRSAVAEFLAAAADAAARAAEDLSSRSA